jgi:mRNA interferase MazF
MVGSAYTPDAGHIIKINFDPGTGHEQQGWRPALVLSPKIYNGKTGLAMVVPITNHAKGYPFEVQLPPQSKVTGVVLSDAIKSLDWRARNAKYAATVPAQVLEAVQERLLALLGLLRP